MAQLDVGRAKHGVGTAKVVSHGQAHIVVSVCSIQMARELRRAGAAIAKGPVPAHNGRGRNGLIREADRGGRTSEALAGREAGLWQSQGRDAVGGCVAATVGIPHNEAHIEGAALHISVAGIAQGGGSAITKIPGEIGEGRRSLGRTIEEGHAERRTGNRIGRDKVCHRRLENADNVGFHHCICTTQHVAHPKLHRVLSGQGIGMARILNARTCAVAKVPLPLGQGRIRLARIQEGHHLARASGSRIPGEVGSRVPQTDIGRLGMGPDAAKHIGRGQGHRVQAIRCVGVDWVGQGGGGAITEIPQEAHNGCRAAGQLGKADGFRCAAHSLAGHKINSRQWPHCHCHRRVVGTAVAVRHGQDHRVGSRGRVGMLRILCRGETSVSKAPLVADDVRRISHRPIVEGHGHWCTAVSITGSKARCWGCQNGHQALLAVLATLAVGDCQANSVHTRRTVGIGHLGAGGCVAVAKLPEPAHNREIRGGSVEELHKSSRASLVIVLHKSRHWSRQIDVLWLGEGVHTAIFVFHSEGHGVNARGIIAMGRVLDHGAVAISEIPFPGHQISGSCAQVEEVNFLGTTHRICCKEGCHRRCHRTNHPARCRNTTFVVGYPQTHLIAARVFIQHCRVFHNRAVAVAKGPSPAHHRGGIPERLILEAHCQRVATHRVRGQEGRCRGAQHADKGCFGLRVGTVQHIRHGQGHGIKPWYCVGFGRIGANTRCAVTEVPGPAHQRCVRGAGIKKLHLGARTNFIRRHVKIRHRVGQPNVLGLGQGVAAAIHIAHNQRDSVGSIGSVGIHRNRRTGGIPVAEGPAPEVQHSTGLGLVKESDGGRGTTCAVAGHKVGHRVGKHPHQPGGSVCTAQCVSGDEPDRIIARIHIRHISLHQPGGHAIAKIPGPAHYRLAVDRGCVGELSEKWGTAFVICNGKGGVWTGVHCDQIGLDHGVHTTQGGCHNQPNRIGPGRGVHMAGVLLGRDAAVAKMPGPARDCGIGQGLVGELHRSTRTNQAAGGGKISLGIAHPDIVRPAQGIHTAVGVCHGEAHGVAAIAGVGVLWRTKR